MSVETFKMKMQKFAIVAVLIGLIVGCQTVIIPTPVVKISPTIISTSKIPLPTPTAPVILTATALPSRTPIPTSTPLSVSSLAEKGRIFVWSNKTKNYLVVDLNAGTISTIRWNPACEWRLLPNTTVTVCENAAGQFYLYDLIVGTKLETSINDAEIIGWSPNGQFLVYSHNIDAGEPILSYQISTNTTETLTARLNLDWLELPVLSADGQTLIAARNYAAWTSRIFEIVRGTSQYRQIGLDKPFSTGDIAWSPVSRRFVYGATDIEQEIGPMPNYLYIVDIQTGKIRELGKSPARLLFWPSSLEWSPTGEEVAVGIWDLAFRSDPQACTINVSTTNQVCLSAQRGYDGRFSAWSPSGEHIAFIDMHNSLVVAKPDGSETVTLLPGIEDDFILMWR
jgi:WD40 repeat protein